MVREVRDDRIPKYLSAEAIAKKYNCTPEMITAIAIDVLGAINETMFKTNRTMTLLSIGSELGLEGAWHYAEIVAHGHGHGTQPCCDALMDWGETCSRYGLMQFEPLRGLWQFDIDNELDE